MATPIDITRPLGPLTDAWPGDMPFGLIWQVPPGAGVAALSHIEMSPHLGTHLDAPLHLDPEGHDVGEVKLESCVGPCELVVLPDHHSPIGLGDLPRNWLPAAPSVLFATASWPLGAPLPTQFGSLSPELVAVLADGGVRLVGIDTPSIDTLEAEELPAHRACAEHGILVIEGLFLEGVIAGLYTLVAAPLRLVGAEASPVRALLLPHIAQS